MNDGWARELLFDLAAIRSGRLKTVSHDQMKIELGLSEPPHGTDEAVEHIATHSRDRLDRLGDVGPNLTDD